jgi:2-polyprenyl-3-methyl-5-hydroxy-6-metoxy-1,4-benzoquinol methylase
MDAAAFREHLQFEQTHWWFRARRHIVSTLLRTALKAQRPRILEIGCGTGGNVESFSAWADCIGAEISSEAVEIGKQAYPSCDLRTYSDLNELATEINSADAILLLDVLEHVLDDRELFAKLIGMARPGTLIAITVPADPDLWSDHDVALFHHRRYTKESLNSLWSDLPLQPLLFCGLNWKLAFLIRLVRRVSRAIFRNKTTTTDLKQPSRLVNQSLYAIFASELTELLSRLNSNTVKFAHSNGISMIAILRRLESKTQIDRLSATENRPTFESRNHVSNELRHHHQSHSPRTEAPAQRGLLPLSQPFSRRHFATSSGGEKAIPLSWGDYGTDDGIH